MSGGETDQPGVSPASRPASRGGGGSPKAGAEGGSPTAGAEGTQDVEGSPEVDVGSVTDDNAEGQGGNGGEMTVAQASPQGGPASPGGTLPPPPQFRGGNTGYSGYMGGVTVTSDALASVEGAMGKVQADARESKKEIAGLRQANADLEAKLGEAKTFLKKTSEDYKVKSFTLKDSDDRNEELFRSLAAGLTRLVFNAPHHPLHHTFDHTIDHALHPTLHALSYTKY
jgi:hypothetical protein